MAEAPAGDLIVADLRHQHWLQRLPLRCALAVPSAGPTGRAAGEARRLDQLLQISGELRAFFRRNGGGEADMMEQAPLIIEAKQERADFLFLLRIAKAADDTVRGALLLDLDHCPLARLVGLLRPLGDDAVECPTAPFEPAQRNLAASRRRRKLKAGNHVLRKEAFQRFSPLR